MKLPPSRKPGACGQPLRVAVVLEKIHEAGRHDLADDVVHLLRDRRLSYEGAANAIRVKLAADARWVGRAPSKSAVRTWRNEFAIMHGDWRAPLDVHEVAS